jgi:hypothetical protein
MIDLDDTWGFQFWVQLVRAVLQISQDPREEGICCCAFHILRDFELRDCKAANQINCSATCITDETVAGLFAKAKIVPLSTPLINCACGTGEVGIFIYFVYLANVLQQQDQFNLLEKA